MKKLWVVKNLALFLVLTNSSSFAQTTDWQLANGKAYAEMHIVLSGKSQDEIYRDLNRWLVKYYTNP
ncbi:MAG TPA: hypothetical protein VGK59_00010, partial [Ohtaekwangia sp.]